MRTYLKPLSLLTLFIALLLVGALSFLLPNGSAVGAPLAGVPPDTTEGLPPGVRIETVLTDMDKPIALAFDPAGRLLYTEKESGKVRLFANGTLQPNAVITFDVSACSERGLLGITLDPSFDQNHYVYVYYTQGPGCGATENKVVRFVENNGTGSNPTVIFSSPQTAGNHNGGNIHFGPDGKLYISVGENANPNNSQDTSVKNGKIHRINPDGTTPTDNPKFGGPNPLPSLYAMGVRNSFDFVFDSVVKGRIFASENGPACDDEMNRIEAGFNYGWHANYACDDTNPPANINTIPPLWYLPSGQCCEAPTGITVYTGNSIPQWKDGLFMSSYQNGAKLRHFYLNADRTALTASKVVEGVTASLDLETGPDGALYYIQGGGYSQGTLKRLVGQGAAPSPTAAPTAPSTGTALPGAGSQTFPQTGKTVTGIFLDYWNGHGKLPQQGYPISGVMMEVSDLNGKSYAVQYFERAVFEYHPENQPPFNVLLSQLGTYQYKRKYPNGAPNQAANTAPNTVTFPETGKRVGGVFLDYWRKNGGLAQQGYPITEEFTEVSDLNGKPYKVQYFERVVLELHPENQPPYDVLLSQLGTFQYKRKYLSDQPVPATVSPKSAAWAQLQQRPLKLPGLEPGAPCPVAVRRQIMPGPPANLSAEYGIGNGPIYPVAYYFGDSTTLQLQSFMQRTPGWFTTKVRWIGGPDYEGPVLVRGQRIDGNGEVRFEFDDLNGLRTSGPKMTLLAYQGWNDWPASTLLPGAGCYAYQVDGISFSQIIVFRAVMEPPPADASPTITAISTPDAFALLRQRPLQLPALWRMTKPR